MIGPKEIMDLSTLVLKGIRCSSLGEMSVSTCCCRISSFSVEFCYLFMVIGRILEECSIKHSTILVEHLKHSDALDDKRSTQRIAQFVARLALVRPDHLLFVTTRCKISKSNI